MSFQGQTFHKTAGVLARLRNELRYVISHRRELERELERELSSDTEQQAEMAINQMKVEVKLFHTLLGRLAKARDAAEQQMRKIQIDFNLFRARIQPHKLMAAFVLMVTCTVETIFASGAMVADGHVDFAAGILYGFMFASSNVAIGFLAGLLGLRYMDYKLTARNQTVIDRLKRRVSKIGFVGALTTLTFLIYTAARVRVTGGHDNLFDFTQYGPFAVFNDGLAIIIMVIGLISSVLSIRKGYMGWEDPSPGYALLVQAAESVSDNAAEGALLDHIENIEDIADDVINEIEQEFDLPDAIADYQDHQDDHNNNVLGEKDQARVDTQQAYEEAVYVLGKENVEKPSYDFDPFDNLLVIPIEFEALKTHQEQIDKIRTARSEAIAQLQAAYAEYLAEIQSMGTLPPEYFPQQ